MEYNVNLYASYVSSQQQKNRQPNWNSVSPSPISIYIILFNIFIGFIFNPPSLYLNSTHPQLSFHAS